MKNLGADHAYWQHLSEGKLCLPKCTGCGKWHWPAVFRCGDCGNWEHNWHEVAANGRVYSWTRNWYDFGGPREYTIPYINVVVQLENVGGIRLLGTLHEHTGTVNIGDPVRGQIIHVEFDGEQLPALQWTLTGEAHSR